MARANTIQTNFTAGEVSPGMYGRVDVNKYFNGARKLRNMVVAPQGGAYRRPGTRYVASVKTAAKLTVARRFIFSETQAYVIEFGDLYVRFYYNGAQLESSPGVPLEVTTPYLEADLRKLKFVQSADVLYIFHPSYQTRKLSRTAHTTWALSLFTTIDGPYSTIIPSVKLTTRLIQDVSVVTASTAIFTASTLKTITNAFQTPAATTISITAVAHGYSTGGIIGIAQVGGLTEANGQWVITVVDVDTFILVGSIKQTGHTYTSGGTASAVPTRTYIEIREDNRYRLAKVISKYSTTQLLVDVTDYTLDVPFERKITFTSPNIVADSPTFSQNDVGKVVRASSGVWYDITAFIDSVTVSASAVTLLSYSSPTTITLTDRLITGEIIAASNTFVSTDLGRKVRLQYDGEWVAGVLDTIISATTAGVTLDTTIPLDPTGPRLIVAGIPDLIKLSCAGIPTTWRFGAWSDTTGYPSAGCFHQDRLWAGGTTAEPQTLWSSETGDYVGFSPSSLEDSAVLDTHGITIALVSREVNPIVWLETGPVLLVGTIGSEWQIKPSAITQSLTPTNIIATPQTSYGSVSTVEGRRVGSTVLFIQNGGKKLREMSYDYSIDAFIAKDLSIISEHIGRKYGKMLTLTIQDNPFVVIWIVTSLGKLIGVTYEREHEVIAWHIHEIGGSGFVEAAECVPSSDGSGDELHLIVKRTISAATARFVEILRHFPEPTSKSDLSDQCFVDAGLSLDNVTPTNVTTTSGLTHLNGESVALVVDGVFAGVRTVSAGAITVGYNCTTIHVGYLNDAIVGMLEPEGGSQAGTSQGKKKRMSQCTARVENSLHFQIASAQVATDERFSVSAPEDPGVGDRTRLRPQIVVNPPSTSTWPNVTSETVELISGDVDFAPDDSFNNGGILDLVQPEPYALNLLALMPVLNTYE